MKIYLMQHGANLPKDIDSEQPLSPMGRESVSRSARAMKRLGIHPELFIASPKARSIQTARLVAEALDMNPDEVVVSEAVKALADEGGILHLLETRKEDSVFIAGHLPHLAKLASLAVSGGPDAHIAFSNAGLACIDTPDLLPGKGALLWLIPAAQLARLS